MESFNNNAIMPAHTNNTYTQLYSFKSGDNESSEHNFTLQKNKGHLKQQFLDVTVNLTVGVGSTGLMYIGASFFKAIRLRSTSSIIQTLTDNLMESRLALLKDTPLGIKIKNGLLKNTDLVTGENNFRIPLMWFFSEKSNDYLTNSYNSDETITVEALVNDSIAKMGFGPAITAVNSLKVKLINEYIKVPADKMPSMKPINNSYDLFNECNACLVAAGETSIEVPLKCGFKVFLVHFRMKLPTLYQDYSINKVVIKGSDGYYREVNSKSNYSLSDNVVSEDLTTSFSVPFGSRLDNYETKNYITFDPSKQVYTATVYFKTLPVGGALLYIISEHHTRVIENDGFIKVEP